MYKQRLDRDGNISCIELIGKNIIIPLDPNNSYYQAYLRWVDGYELQIDSWIKTSAGNTPLPADEA